MESKFMSRYRLIGWYSEIFHCRRVFWKCSLPRMDYLNRLNVVHRQSVERSRFITDLTMFYSILNYYFEYNILKGFKLSAYLIVKFTWPFC